jgi:hypothetical protein
LDQDFTIDRVEGSGNVKEDGIGVLLLIDWEGLFSFSTGFVFGQAHEPT